MISLRTLVAGLTDESLRTATLVGLASIPFTIALSWNSVTLPHEIASNGGIHFDATISGAAIFVAGTVVGYLYAGRPTEVERAGTRAGVVGSAPMIALILLAFLVQIWFASTKIVSTLVLTLLIPLTVVLSAGVGALVGLVGASLGEWVADRVGRGRPTEANA